MADQDPNALSPPKTSLVWTAFGFIVVMMIANWVAANWMSNDRGTFGDLFGAVNALFSGLAFVGVVYAILLQRYEVRIARGELQNAHAMFKDQQEELKNQNDQTKRQVFENTFFQLLTLLTTITASIGVSNGRHGFSYGKDAFPLLIRELRTHFQGTQQPGDFNAGYESFYNQYGPILGHYYRTVYNILKFVDHAKIKEKKFYTNILRAQISDVEAALLLHNAASRHGAEKFQPLAVRYKLFKNVRDEDLVDPGIRARFHVDAFR